MKDINTNFVVRVLRKMTSNLDENKHLDIIIKEIKTSTSAFGQVSAIRLMKEYAVENSNEQTANLLMERMETYGLIPKNIVTHDIGTYDGFMEAVAEVMAEMASGAAIGGSFDGAQTNADANSTGMAAPNGKERKKRKGLENVLKRYL